jgi:hypothetical protein
MEVRTEKNCIHWNLIWCSLLEEFMVNLVPPQSFLSILSCLNLNPLLQIKDVILSYVFYVNNSSFYIQVYQKLIFEGMYFNKNSGVMSFIHSIMEWSSHSCITVSERENKGGETFRHRKKTICL